MKRTFAYRDGKMVELTPSQVEAVPQIMDDVKEFRSPDGAYIGGRAQWREHLKRTDSVEMGHSDIKAAQINWQKKRAAFQDKLGADQNVTPVNPPPDMMREYGRSRITSEVMNRLDGRPAPDRKTLIKMAMEEARRR